MFAPPTAIYTHVPGLICAIYHLLPTKLKVKLNHCWNILSVFLLKKPWHQFLHIPSNCQDPSFGSRGAINLTEGSWDRIDPIVTRLIKFNVRLVKGDSENFRVRLMTLQIQWLYINFFVLDLSLGIQWLKLILNFSVRLEIHWLDTNFLKGPRWLNELGRWI